MRHGENIFTADRVMESISEINFNRAQDAIARCAYLIWESEGRPEGRAVEHWILAESRLLAAGQIVAVPENFQRATGANSTPPHQRRRYGLVLTQKNST